MTTIHVLNVLKVINVLHFQQIEVMWCTFVLQLDAMQTMETLSNIK